MRTENEKQYDFFLFVSGGNPDGPMDIGSGSLSDGKMIVEDLEVRYGDWEGRDFPENEKGAWTFLEGSDIMAFPRDKVGMTYIFGDNNWEEFGDAQ